MAAEKCLISLGIKNYYEEEYAAGYHPGAVTPSIVIAAQLLQLFRRPGIAQQQNLKGSTTYPTSDHSSYKISI